VGVRGLIGSGSGVFGAGLVFSGSGDLGAGLSGFGVSPCSDFTSSTMAAASTGIIGNGEGLGDLSVSAAGESILSIFLSSSPSSSHLSYSNPHHNLTIVHIAIYIVLLNVLYSDKKHLHNFTMTTT